MSEERLERIEKKQDTMLADIAKLETGQTKIRADIATLETGQTKMLADIAELGTGQAEMRVDIAGLKTGQDALGRQMRVLHEDAISRIKAIPEYSGPTKQEFEQGLADLKEAIGRRLDPLEATVRRLSGG